MKTIDKLAEQFKREGHGDEAWALENVDRLMREYAYTKDPLTKDAEQLGADLRDLVAEWKSVTELPPPQVGEDEGSSCCVRCWKNDGHCPHYKRGLHHCLYFIPAAPVPPPQRERKTERESKWEVVWRNELIAVCDALAEVLNISTCPRVGWQECVRLIKERLSKQPAAPVAPAVERQINAPDIPIKRPTANGCLIIGCEEYDKDGNICLHIGACPHTMFDAKPCPSCEKLRAENERLMGIIERATEITPLNCKELLKTLDEAESVLNQPKGEG